MKNILFITWDGPQTSYMEGLFMPIFQKISEREKIQFHVMQFTWADESRTASIRKTAEKMGIHYTAEKVCRKPIVSIGSFLTVQSGTKKIKKYIRDHGIDVVMLRSTFPAMMVNRLKGFEGAMIFDADGLPIEERIDFAGLKRGSFLYNWMKSAETQMLKKSDAVITRSEKAIDIHLENIGEGYRDKFSVVSNGRDAEKFKFQEEWRRSARKELGVEDEFLFVYAGSLGPQYCWEEMLSIFRAYKEKGASKFLILTGNFEFANSHLPEDLKSEVFVKTVASDEVPYWLNAGDLAFGLRKPTYSMQGVAPIKLGEYLLCGIPVIASKGIGDSEEILSDFGECYLYDHSIGLSAHEKEVLAFIEKSKLVDRAEIRRKALGYFSLESSAESYLKVLSSLK